MTDNKDCATTKRFAWVALILSFVLPGTGHVYCGRIGIGLLLILLFGISTPIMAGIVSNLSPVQPAMLVFSGFVVASIWVFAALHAAALAFKTRPDYRLKDYNRIYIYLLLILIGTGSSLAYIMHTKNRFLEVFVVPTSSMYPTIVGSDRVVGTKGAYKNENIRRGDIVLFANPENPGILYADRVIALEGDFIEMRNSDVYVNDQKLIREPISADDVRWMENEKHQYVYFEHNEGVKYKIMLEPRANPAAIDYPKTRIPKNHIFLMGDNRNNSKDSRSFGPVPMVGVKGRVDYLLWPAKSWSRFGRIHLTED